MTPQSILIWNHHTYTTIIFLTKWSMTMPSRPLLLTSVFEKGSFHRSFERNLTTAVLSTNVPKCWRKTKSWQKNMSEPSGHRKGLVDAMSSFGCKSPLHKAVLMKDFKYRSSYDIHELLTVHFKDEAEDIFSHRSTRNIGSSSGGSKSCTYSWLCKGFISNDMFQTRWICFNKS